VTALPHDEDPEAKDGQPPPIDMVGPIIAALALVTVACLAIVMRWLGLI
jgi:hypothetical protein